MPRDSGFEDLSDSSSQSDNDNITTVLNSNSILEDGRMTQEERQHDVWGDNILYLPELGTNLHGEPDQQSNDRSNYNTNVQPITFHTYVPAQVSNSEEATTNIFADAKTAFAPNLNLHQPSFVSAGAQSNVAPINGSTINPQLGCSSIYTPQTNQLSFSSLMSVGNPTMPTNNNNNNNGMTYQQASPTNTTMPGNIPTFFTTNQGGHNVVMLAHPPSAQTLCIPAGATTMFPYYVLSPPQPGLEANGPMAYSPIATAPQPMGAVMCSPWHPAAAAAAVGNASSNNSAVAAAQSGMPPNFTTTQVPVSATQPVTNFPTTEVNSNSGSIVSPIHPCGDARTNQNAPPKGSPPSYDSIRLQLTKRRQPPGRQRSGTNVHGSLQGICTYYSYNLSAALKQYEQPDSHPPQPGEQVLLVFIQMFPCELRDRTIIVLNRVIEATCGPDIATVVGVEPRSETSFITHIRTGKLWELIYRLRCRVLMDRHGFWYAENMEQYVRLKEYCEGVRRLPQQMRHYQTDGLPCMPLVVELARSLNAAEVLSPPADRPFDEVVPIATVERHARAGTATGSNDGDLETSTPSTGEAGEELTKLIN